MSQSGAGAPLGNQNAAKGKRFLLALEQALDRSTGGGRFEQKQALDAIADNVVNMALDGDKDAITWIADRLDGKPKATIEGPGEGGAHIIDTPPNRPQITREEWLAFHGLAATAGPTASGA